MIAEEFCLAHSGLLEGKRVVELGAGIGMTGMAAAACCGASEVVLTDYAPRVLANLHFNVEINRPLLDTSKRKHCSGSGDSPVDVGGTASLLHPPSPTTPPPTDVSVRFLDWTDYCQHDGTSLPVSPAKEDTTGGPKTVPASTRGQHSAEAPSAVASPAAAADHSYGNGNDVAGTEPRNNTLGASSASASAAGGGPCAPGGSQEEHTSGRKDGLLSVRSGCLSSGGGGGGGGDGDDPLGTPEVVLAADVVYDVKYHPALVGVVVETLRRCPDALVVFASTLRNSATMAAFHRCLEEAGVPWANVPFPATDAVTETKSAMSVSAKSPPFREGQEEAEEVKCGAPATASAASEGCHGRTAAWWRSDPDSAPLWCHPGDLERVKFCVCGRGVGLVPK